MFTPCSGYGSVSVTCESCSSKTSQFSFFFACKLTKKHNMRTETRRSAPSSIHDSMPVPQPLKSKRAWGTKPATNAKTTTSSVHQHKMTFQKHYATPETRRKTLKRHRQFTNTKLTFRLKTLCHPGSPTRNAKTTTLSVYQYKMTFQKHYATPESLRETLKERPRLFNNTKLTSSSGPKHYATPETPRETLKQRPCQLVNTKWHPGQKHYATPESQRETLKRRPRQFTNDTKWHSKITMPRCYRFSTNTTIMKADHQLTRPVNGLVWLASFNTSTCLQKGTGRGRDPRSQKVAKEVNST